MNEETPSLIALQKHLSELSAGPVANPSVLEHLLFKCWHEFDGGEQTSMDGHKLLNRTENMRWNPPCLEFEIERHGATVNSSVYAEIQSWTVHVERKLASAAILRKRQVGRKSKGVKTQPLAEMFAKLILARTTDPRLIWKSDTKVRIDIEKVIPATNAQTTSSRRKRFRTDLQASLKPHAWRMTTTNTFEKESGDE